MSGGKRTFDVEIVGVDKSAPAFKRLDDSIHRADAPIRKMNRGIGDIARASSGAFRGIGQEVRGVGQEVRGVGDLLTGMLLPSFSALAGGFTVAGAVSIAQNFSTVGAEIRRTSDLIGIAEDELQALRGMARLAGVDIGNVESAWLGFADALQRAKLGDPQTIAALNALGVAIPDRLTPGNIRAALDQAIAGLQQFDTHGRRVIAGATGLSSGLPLFGLGPERLRELEAAWRATNAQLDPGAVDAAKRADEAFKKLQLTVDALMLTLGFRLSDVSATASEAGAMAAGNLNQLIKDPRAWFRSVLEHDTLGSFGQDLEHLTPRRSTAAPGPHALPPGMPSLFEKRIDTFTGDELRAFGRGRGVSQSGADGRVIINLRVESEPGLRTRAVVQDEGRVQTEVVMQPGAP